MFQKSSIVPSLTCPVTAGESNVVSLAHGEGARLSRRLIHRMCLDVFNNTYLQSLTDAATLPHMEGRPVMTTDSYVVSPLFFPGGDIGKLAVFGSVNDLAVCGAEPLYLSLGLIIEEGFPFAVLEKVMRSIRDSAASCGVEVVTGDTKVVPKGAADGLFINTTGIGRLLPGVHLGFSRIREGDRILVNGTIGDHGITILSARENLGFDSELQSDTAPLHGVIRALFEGGINVHFMRDATRGGVSAVLHEVCEAANVSVVLEESALPVSTAVRGACELLGLDPLYIANEGKMVLFVAEPDAEKAMKVLQQTQNNGRPSVIGTVTKDHDSEVLVMGVLGALRVVDEPNGAPQPRIC